MATSTLEMSLHATVQMTKKAPWAMKGRILSIKPMREMPKEGDNERRRGYI